MLVSVIHITSKEKCCQKSLSGHTVYDLQVKQIKVEMHWKMSEQRTGVITAEYQLEKE